MREATLQPVCIDLEQIKRGTADQWLDEAFSADDALGMLLVTGMPSEYAKARLRVLTKSPFIATMCQDTEGDWGVSGMTRGGAVGDNLKSSWYLSNNFLRHANADQCDAGYPPEFDGPFTRRNIWPRQDEFPGLRRDVELLVSFLYEALQVVARAIDRTYKLGVSIEQLLEDSDMIRSRLTHYHPGSHQSQPEHRDFSVLTALTGAAVVDVQTLNPTYDQVVRTFGGGLCCGRRQPVGIPSNAIGIKVGSALELLSQGRLRSVKHQFFGDSELNIANFILFGQPRLNFDLGNGTLYGKYIHDEVAKVILDQKRQTSTLSEPERLSDRRSVGLHPCTPEAYS